MLTKAEAADVDPSEKLLGFSYVGALAENPRDKLKLGNIVSVFSCIGINSVTNEIEPSHAETFFVDGVIK